MAGYRSWIEICMKICEGEGFWLILRYSDRNGFRPVTVNL